MLWKMTLEVTSRVARSGYPPKSYGESKWDSRAVEELAQDVAIERLIGEKQIDYVMEQATDLDSLSRLLAFQAKRALSRRRAVTVVDKLLDRVRKMDLGSFFQVLDLGSDQFVAPVEGGREPANLSEDDLRRGAHLIGPIPRLASRPEAQRESKVYNRDDLFDLLNLLVEEFSGILLRDLRKVLELTLTAWLPTVLYDHEEDRVEYWTPELEAQRTEMRNLVSEMVADLSLEHRVVLLGKARGLPDGALAQQLDRSRPWAADRKREVLDMTEMRVIAGLPPELHEEATRELIAAVEELENDDD
jgi:hypothetical protein